MRDKPSNWKKKQNRRAPPRTPALTKNQSESDLIFYLLDDAECPIRGPIVLRRSVAAFSRVEQMARKLAREERLRCCIYWFSYDGEMDGYWGTMGSSQRHPHFFGGKP